MDSDFLDESIPKRRLRLADPPASLGELTALGQARRHLVEPEVEPLRAVPQDVEGFAR